MNQANRPFTMNMELTTRCPLMCPFCYCTLNDSPNPPAMLGRLEEVVTGMLK